MSAKPDIHLHRAHRLDPATARALAQQWMAQVGPKYGLECRTGDDGVLHFERGGIDGTLEVRPDAFELRAELGFFFKAMAPTLQAEIARKLDAMIAKAEAGGAA